MPDVAPVDAPDAVSWSIASRSSWSIISNITHDPGSDLDEETVTVAASAPQPAIFSPAIVAEAKNRRAPGAHGTVLSSGGFGVIVSPYRPARDSGHLYAGAIDIPLFICYIGHPDDRDEDGWIYAEFLDDPSERGWIPASHVVATEAVWI